MKEIKMQVSDIKQRLDSFKAAIADCNSAIQERIQFKKICDDEIEELETLKSSLLLSLNIEGSINLRARAAFGARDKIDKAIMSVIDAQEKLMIKQVHQAITLEYGITTQEETTRKRIYTLLEAGILEKVDPNAGRGMEFRLTEKGKQRLVELKKE